MTDVQFVKNFFDVNEDKAKELISKGINIDFLKTGYSDKIKQELDFISSKFKNKVEDIKENN